MHSNIGHEIGHCLRRLLLGVQPFGPRLNRNDYAAKRVPAGLPIKNCELRLNVITRSTFNRNCERVLVHETQVHGNGQLIGQIDVS